MSLFRVTMPVCACRRPPRGSAFRLRVHPWCTLGGRHNLRWRKPLRQVAVQDVGVEVGPVRPDDRPQLLVDPHLAEELTIVPQWLEHRTPDLVLEVDLACRPVVEPEPKDESLERLDRADACGPLPRGRRQAT